MFITLAYLDTIENNVPDVLIKFKKPPFWLVIFLVVHFNKIPLFSKDLITFIISFTSLFVRVIPKPVIDEIRFLEIFLPTELSPVSVRISSFFIFLAPMFFDSFAIEFANKKLL